MHKYRCICDKEKVGTYAYSLAYASLCKYI